MLYFIERLYLSEDRELDVRKERYVFFFGDINVATPQRRSSTHYSHSQAHTHSHTHTHTHDWPTVAIR